MLTIISLLLVVFALKLVEANGGLEFTRSEAPFVAAVAFELGGWVVGMLLALVLPDLGVPTSLNQALLLFFARQLFFTMILLLLAWAFVPGFHVRRLSGLIFASILIVGFTYAAAVLVPTVGFGL